MIDGHTAHITDLTGVDPHPDLCDEQLIVCEQADGPACFAHVGSGATRPGTTAPRNTHNKLFTSAMLGHEGGTVLVCLNGLRMLGLRA